MTSVILHLNILFSYKVTIELTIWLILKFWSNKFRNSSVTHCPKFILFRPFYSIDPKVIEFCLLYSEYLLVPSFKLVFKLWLMIQQYDYTQYIKRFDSS
jgi:hypothetical protein